MNNIGSKPKSTSRSRGALKMSYIFFGDLLNRTKIWSYGFMHRSLMPFLLLVVVISIGMLWVPRYAIDPWGVLNPYKLLQLIFLLSVIQILSAFLMRFFNRRFGGIALGFLGGLISSTAFTASLSKQSHQSTENEVRLLSLSYLSALLGTALEACGLAFLGASEFHWELGFIFMGPLVVTLLLIVWRARTLREVHFTNSSNSALSVTSVIKLSFFILIILAVSKVLQNAVGEYGVFVLTFLVCLFELHGSIIANVQMHEAGDLTVRALGHSIMLGLLASYLAKMTLVILLGRRDLGIRVKKYTVYLVSALLVGWIAFYFSAL